MMSDIKNAIYMDISLGLIKIINFINQSIAPLRLKLYRIEVDCRERGSHAKGKLPHSLYSPYENRYMEIRVGERHEKISGKV